MTYNLAFDRGFLRSNDRYIKIDNANIHTSLDSNNNLMELLTFTLQFENEQDLKDVLVKLNPKLKIYRHFNLVIIWKRKYKGREYTRCNRVPYSSDAKYFNFESLVKIIEYHVYNPFFNKFLDSYKSCMYLSNEIDNLYATVMEYKPMYIIEDAIRAFLNKELCSKGVLSFSKLYKMAMLMSKLLEDENKKNIKEDKTKRSQSLEYGLSETELWQLEWLKERVRLREKNNGYY